MSIGADCKASSRLALFRYSIADRGKPTWREAISSAVGRTVRHTAAAERRGDRPHSLEKPGLAVSHAQDGPRQQTTQPGVRRDGQTCVGEHVTGSVTKLSFIRSVEACRAAEGAADGYRAWHRHWFILARNAIEESTHARVESVPSTD